MGLLRDSWDTGDAVSRVFVAGVVAKRGSTEWPRSWGALSCSSSPATC